MSYLIASSSILTSAQGLIKRGWCQGAFARNSSGIDVDPGSSEAVSWSILGAIEAARRLLTLNGARGVWYPEFIVTSVSSAAGVIEVEQWNDELLTTKEKVLKAFEKSFVILGGLIVIAEKQRTTRAWRMTSNIPRTQGCQC